MTINEEIRENIEIFLINTIKKMIENEQFDTIYEIERIKYGDYNIIFNNDNIALHYKSIHFYFQFSEKKIEKNTLFGFSFGKGKTKLIKTKIGEMVDIYYKKMKEYQEIKDNKDMIDSLPDDIKKQILRKRKLENILEDNDSPNDELRDSAL